jgi:hypothetical protein
MCLAHDAGTHNFGPQLRTATEDSAMYRLLIPVATATAMSVVGVVVGANADGILPPRQASAPAASVAAAPAAGCPIAPVDRTAGAAAMGAPATARPRLAAAAPATTTPPASPAVASAPADRPESPLAIATHWRDQVARWIGDATRDLTIEYTYPEDVESEPAHAPYRAPHTGGEV